MERSLLRRVPAPSADDILYDLTMRQHLKPHRSIGEALSDAASGLGLCVMAAGHALARLQIEPTGSIGRLRRGQLVQLSGCIHRYWRRAGVALGPSELTGFDGFDKPKAGKLTAGGSSFGSQALDECAQSPGVA